MRRWLAARGRCPAPLNAGAVAAAVFLVFGTVSSRAQSTPPAQAEHTPSVVAPEPTGHVDPTFEGAVGLVAAHGPAFRGSSDIRTKLAPAGFVRWGRFTVTGAGGFTTRRNDDVERGLQAELIQGDRVRVRLGLRLDNGRDESDSPDLAGMGDIRPTVRARLAVQWDPSRDWRLGAGIGVDALNRVGGFLVDASVARHWAVGPGQVFTVTASLSAAGDRYLQAWHGVTPAQSAASGYAVFVPHEGLRDVAVSAVWRSELPYGWAGFVGLGYSRLLGGAADSPLTRRVGSAGLTGGLAWRF